MVQMRGHNICFYAELTKLSLIIVNYSLLSRAEMVKDKVGITVFFISYAEGSFMLLWLQCAL